MVNTPLDDWDLLVNALKNNGHEKVLMTFPKVTSGTILRILLTIQVLSTVYD